MSEDDLQILEDDEEEFDISEENLSEEGSMEEDDVEYDEIEEGMEEEEEEIEEEMEKELEKQWSEDDEAAAAKKKHAKAKHAKKSSNSISNSKSNSNSNSNSKEPAEILPIVDVSRFPLKKRIFTEDRIDPSPAAQAPTVPRVCAFCHRGEQDVPGGFVSPHPFVGAKGFVFVHRLCVLSHSEVARSSTRYFNVIKAVNASKKVRCQHCNAFGATLCCAVSGCLKYPRFLEFKIVGIIIPAPKKRDCCLPRFFPSRPSTRGTIFCVTHIRNTIRTC